MAGETAKLHRLHETEERLLNELRGVRRTNRGRKAAIMTVTVVGFSALTWAAHARLGALLLKP